MKWVFWGEGELFVSFLGPFTDKDVEDQGHCKSLKMKDDIPGYWQSLRPTSVIWGRICSLSQHQVIHSSSQLTRLNKNVYGMLLQSGMASVSQEGAKDVLDKFLIWLWKTGTIRVYVGG